MLILKEFMVVHIKLIYYERKSWQIVRKLDIQIGNVITTVLDGIKQI